MIHTCTLYGRTSWEREGEVAEGGAVPQCKAGVASVLWHHTGRRDLGNVDKVVLKFSRVTAEPSVGWLGTTGPHKLNWNRHSSVH